MYHFITRRLPTSTVFIPRISSKPLRNFSTTAIVKMPDALKKEEVERGQDPSVMKQWDNETSVEKKFEDMYAIADKLGVCMMGTARPGLGVSVTTLVLAPFHI